MHSKVYFPRLIVPASAVIVSFVDFWISGMILLALMAWYNFVPDWRILTLPLFIRIAFAAAMAADLGRQNSTGWDSRYLWEWLLWCLPVASGISVRWNAGLLM